MERDDWFTLVELTQRLGALVWVEEKLFELLGRWAVIESVPQVAVLFATTSRHHGWHAEIVESCLPTSPQLRTPDVIVPPTPGWQDAVVSLSTLTDAEATTARLRSLVKVVDPWVSRETESLLELARPVSDAAIARWLRFVEIDHHDDGHQIAPMLAALEQATVRFDDHIVVAELDLNR